MKRRAPAPRRRSWRWRRRPSSRHGAPMPGVDEEALGARGQHPDTEAPAFRVSGIVGGWTRPQRLDARVGEGDVGHGRFSLWAGAARESEPGRSVSTRRFRQENASQNQSVSTAGAFIGVRSRRDSTRRQRGTAHPAGSPSCAGTIQGAWIHGEFRRVNSLTDHGCRATEGV